MMSEQTMTIRSNPCARRSAPPAPALETRGLTYVRGRRPVFRDIDLAVAGGEIVALSGANGAGKTTLLECLAGALRPMAGQVLWFGESARSPATRGLIGFLGHDSGLYLTLTARENLLFAGRMCGLYRAADRADELLSATGLGHHSGKRAERLSRGMRQRLAIARALFHNPSILLLDEPLTNLDADGRDWLTQFLRDLRSRNRAILLVTHSDELSRGMADRRLYLSEGRLAAANRYARGA